MPPDTGTAAEANPQQTLFVVFHGLISLIDITGDGFIANLLEIAGDHAYLAGDWLLERPVAPGSRAKLSGVDSGTAKLDPKRNPVVRGLTKPPALDPRFIRAQIFLPRPKAIHYFRSGTLDRASVTQTAGTLQLDPAFEQLSGIKVFEYEFPDIAKVGLSGDIEWKPTDTVGSERPSCAIHIYDEPAAALAHAQAHNIREFRLSAEVLGSGASVAAGTKVSFEDIPLPSLHKLELSPLQLRPDVLKGIARDMRRGRAVSSPIGGTSSEVCAGSDGSLP